MTTFGSAFKPLNSSLELKTRNPNRKAQFMTSKPKSIYKTTTTQSKGTWAWQPDPNDKISIYKTHLINIVGNLESNFKPNDMYYTTTPITRFMIATRIANCSNSRNPNGDIGNTSTIFTNIESDERK
ncbi:hypothetical protein HanRHA438_Chr09g0416361 [Helianthus annuus]|nr:hypothetical protein HanRHA438_Chr09g0416361 [Helianthus annuus]